MTNILPCHLHHQKYHDQLSREHQGNLELGDHVDHKAQVYAFIQRRYTNLEMEAPSLTIKGEYWSDDDYSSMPFTSSKIRTIPRTPRKSRIG